MDAALEAGDETKALQLITPFFAIFLEEDGSGDDVGDVDRELKHFGNVLSRFDVSWIHAQMATVGVGLLERRGQYSDATRILLSLLSHPSAPDRRGGWYIRAATNLGHLGRFHAALRICEAGLGDTWVRCGDRLGVDETGYPRCFLV